MNIRFHVATARLAAALFLATSWMAVAAEVAAPRVIEVEPGPAAAITAAVAAAEAGDLIQLQAGTYTGTVEIRRSGKPDRPIVIAGPPGDGERAVINGLGTPASGQSNQAFRIEDSAWLVVRDIDAVNCWTNVISIQDSSYISVVSCRIIDCGRSAVSASGPKSHHILVENCKWTQDERVYSTWDWNELHHGNLEHYNGGIYGGTNAAGGAVVRFNHVSNVFNGLRWWMRESDANQRQYQSNIEIYGNIFDRCRDNAIEPECYTWNLHIYHNELNATPAPVSIDSIKGGEIYFYGNTGLWRKGEEIGQKGDNPPVTRSWTTYKFAPHERGGSLDHPLHIYHNSWDYNQTFARGGRARKANDHVIHYNNALHHQSSGIGLQDWPGEYCEFDYDISSSPWTEGLISAGFQKHGIPNTDPKFRSTSKGDFRLKDDSAAIGAGKVIDGFTLWYVGKGPDMGAYEGGQRMFGQPFMHRDPPGGALYDEMPRIVRIFARGRKMAVLFSAPLDPETIAADSLQFHTGSGALEITGMSAAGEARPQVLQVELAQALPENISDLDLRFGESPPRSPGGTNATLWAADPRVIRIPDDATLTKILEGLL